MGQGVLGGLAHPLEVERIEDYPHCLRGEAPVAADALRYGPAACESLGAPVSLVSLDTPKRRLAFSRGRR